MLEINYSAVSAPPPEDLIYNAARQLRGYAAKLFCRSALLCRQISCIRNIKNLVPYRLNALLPFRKTAFTLAETLITLAIIGIVAAITLPTLIQNHRDKAIITGVKQAYSLLNNAFSAAQNKYGPANTWTEIWETEDTVKIQEMWFDRIAENLKVINNCGTRQKCYGQNKIYVNYINSTTPKTDMLRHKMGILSNGMIIATHSFRHAMPNNSPQWWGVYGAIMVDINGTKRPNTYGKDIFVFVIDDPLSNWNTVNPARLMPTSSRLFPTNECLDGSMSAYFSGSACTAWVIEYQNVDYLHCRQKLKDTGTHSCKEANSQKK